MYEHLKHYVQYENQVAITKLKLLFIKKNLIDFKQFDI